MPRSDIIFGDINVRYGRASRDKTTWNLDRGRLIDASASLRSLTHTLPTSGCSRNDHVFARLPLKWEYTWMPRNEFNSDHGRMCLEISTSASQSEPSRRSFVELPRYSFGCLREPILQDIITNDWKHVSYPKIKEFVSKVHMHLNLNQGESQRHDVQDLVNDAYDMFMQELYYICDTFLPTYQPSEIKKTPDLTLNLDGNLNTAEIIRLFKRSQRAFASSKLVESRDPSLSPIDEAHRHYQDLYSGGATDEPEPPSLPKVTCDSSMHAFLAPEEVSKAIRSYSSAKTGGPDRVDTRLLKCLNHTATFSDVISDLFKLFWVCGVTPTTWNISRIHLLLKDPLEPYADKTRPIALTNVMRRIFEKLLLQQWLTADWASLNRFQAGFRRGWSTISHILLSDDLSRSGFPVSVFLDLKNAFDRVPHRKLLHLLEKRGIPNRSLSLIYSLMMHECQSLLSVNHETHSESISRGQGVFQGSILSPFLFNLFIDSLAQRLNSGVFPGIVALLFADDIVLKAKNRHCAQEAITACVNWAKDHGMLWGLNKCGIMGPKKQADQPQSPVFMEDDSIPEVDEYKYLGLPHRRNGMNWAAYCGKIVDKHNSLLNAFFLKRKPWSYYTRICIYRTFIRSTIEYCLGPLCTWISRQTASFKNELWSLLENCHKRALIWIFDTKSPKLLLENISGLGDFNSRVEMLQGSMANHLRSMSEHNPLRIHHQKNFLSASSDFILPFCLQSPLLDKWISQSRDPTASLSWKTFVRNSWIYKNQTDTGVLQNYVLNRCRRSNKMDSFLLLPLPQAARILQWRCNRSFTRGYCPVCQKQFNRAHLTRCSLISFFSSSIQEISSSEEYTRDIEAINNQLTLKTAPCSQALVYTLLDYLLNEKRYEEFLNALDILKEMIFGPTMVSRN